MHIVSPNYFQKSVCVCLYVCMNVCIFVLSFCTAYVKPLSHISSLYARNKGKTKPALHTYAQVNFGLKIDFFSQSEALSSSFDYSGTFWHLIDTLADWKKQHSWCTHIQSYNCYINLHGMLYYSNLVHTHRYVVLVFNEMKIKENLVFNMSSSEIAGLGELVINEHFESLREKYFVVGHG